MQSPCSLSSCTHEKRRPDATHAVPVRSNPILIQPAAPRLRLWLEGCAAVAPNGASGAAQRPAAPRRRTMHGRSCARCASSTAAGATACASAARARARAARRRPLVRPRPLARACSGARPCPGSALGPDCSMGPLPLALLHPPPQCRMTCRMTYATDKTPSMQPGLTRARGRRRGRGGRAAQHGRGARRAQRGDLLCGRAPGRAAAPRRAGSDPTLPYPTLCRSGAPYQSRSNTQPSLTSDTHRRSGAVRERVCGTIAQQRTSCTSRVPCVQDGIRIGCQRARAGGRVDGGGVRGPRGPPGAPMRALRACAGGRPARARQRAEPQACAAGGTCCGRASLRRPASASARGLPCLAAKAARPDAHADSVWVPVSHARAWAARRPAQRPPTSELRRAAG